VVAHICNSSTWEAKAGGSKVQGQPVLCSKFKAINPDPFSNRKKKKKQAKEGTERNLL
jgi:hypothetical protein